MRARPAAGRHPVSAPPSGSPPWSTAKESAWVLPLKRLTHPPTGELGGLFAQRARLTRYLVDLGLSLPRTS